MSVLVVLVGWIAGRALASAGQTASAVGAVVGAVAVALALAGIAAATLGSGRVAAHDVPVPLLFLAVLVPGVAAPVAAGRMPQHELRETWDDAAWLRWWVSTIAGAGAPLGLAALVLDNDSWGW